jgi:hypothetical protein
MNRKMVSNANSGSSFRNNNGIAKIFDTFRSIQFSIFLRDSNHMPAQAVELIHASHSGTVESVKALSIKTRATQPPKTIDNVIIQSAFARTLVHRV